MALHKKASNKLTDKEEIYDPLDMNNYRVEQFKKINKVGFERWMELAERLSFYVSLKQSLIISLH